MTARESFIFWVEYNCEMQRFGFAQRGGQLEHDFHVGVPPTAPTKREADTARNPPPRGLPADPGEPGVAMVAVV